MAAMLGATAALSTPLAAQSLGLGIAGTLGSGWQIEALDVGYTRSMRVGPLRSASVGARLGGFVDEGAILGGSRGFIGAVVLATRTGLVHLADIGNVGSVTQMGLDLTLEAVGYAGAHSPLPQGATWGAVSVLPGIRFGQAPGPRYGLAIGPTVFLGKATTVHPFIGLRFEAPLHHAGQP